MISIYKYIFDNCVLLQRVLNDRQWAYFVAIILSVHISDHYITKRSVRDIMVLASPLRPPRRR